MSTEAVAFLIFLAAMTFVVGQLCFFAYDTSTVGKRLRHRVDLLFPGRLAAAQASSRSRTPPSAMPSQLMTLALRGDELEFARRIERFHIPVRFAARLFLTLRLSSCVILTMALILLGYRYAGIRTMLNLVGLGLVGAVIGWLLPHFVIGRLALRRRRSIAHGLAEAIELLVIGVEAGLSLEDAINRIVVELRSSQPAMAAELALTSADLKILPSRDDALHRLAERVGLPSVSAMVVTLSQTLRYGTPLAQALRVVAAELRDDSFDQARGTGQPNAGLADRSHDLVHPAELVHDNWWTGVSENIGRVSELA